MNIKIILAFCGILLQILCQQPQSLPLVYKSKDGHSYDFSSLEQNPYWEVKESATDSGIFTIAYIFNFGSNLPQCQGKSGSYEALDVLGQLTDSCDLLGQSQTQTVTEMQDHKGIIITQTEGETCQASENDLDIGKAKSINFKVFCARKADTTWKATTINSDRITSCNVELSINHPAGCYLGLFSSFSFTRVLMWSFILLLIYHSIGYYYNKQYKNVVGLDAVPHNQFWKEFPKHSMNSIRSVSSWLRTTFKSVLGKLKNRGNGNLDNENYSNL